MEVGRMKKRKITEFFAENVAVTSLIHLPLYPNRILVWFAPDVNPFAFHWDFISKHPHTYWKCNLWWPCRKEHSLCSWLTKAKFRVQRKTGVWPDAFLSWGLSRKYGMWVVPSRMTQGHSHAMWFTLSAESFAIWRYWVIPPRIPSSTYTFGVVP